VDIAKIHIEYAQKSGFTSTSCDGVCHTKVLPYLSVVQAVEGSYDIQLDNGRTYNTGNGGFFIAPSNVHQRIIHNTDPASKKMICRWILIKIKINDIYSFDEKFSFPTILPENIKTEINAVFDRLFCADNTFDEYICYYEIIKLLSLVANEKEQPLPPYIDQALHYIKDNYREKISVEDIAAQVQISSSHLFAVFKKQMGVSPISFLNSYRMSIASELLKGTTKSINQIAAEVGIDDSIYFNKIFKKHYQMSPTEYRNCYITKAR
jgi:AraC-like DNA-binding protein